MGSAVKSRLSSGWDDTLASRIVSAALSWRSHVRANPRRLASDKVEATYVDQIGALSDLPR